MTNKTIIDGIDVNECKYKIQSTENFKTKPYCSILNKFCEEVSLVCDKNCQVFEDLKQLARAREEIEEIQKEFKIESLKDITTGKRTYRSLMLIDLKQECEELKSNNKILCDMWKTADRNNAKHVVQTDKYKQALDEILEIAKNDCENCCECTTEFDIKESCSIYEIQDIIKCAKDKNVLHKAKDGE